MTRNKEEWRPISDYEKLYEVSDFGRVRSSIDRVNTFAGKILKNSIGGSCYPCVGLYKNGNKRSFLVHRLVIAAFIGPCPKDKQVNHKDGDKTNSRLENLEYVTGSENQLHAYAIGLASHRGENNSRSKLTEENVYEIRRLILEGMPQIQIAARFGVHPATINSIASGKNWAYLKEEDGAL